VITLFESKKLISVIILFPYKNEKFYERLRERFLEHVESLQTVSRAEMATLQRLDDVYIFSYLEYFT